MFGFEINLWVLLGFAGQFVFFMRFIVQWVVSEKRGESIIPTAFWYLSIIGAIIILIYALYREDPVFILGQGAALFIYTRNLILIHRKKRRLNTLTNQ